MYSKEELLEELRTDLVGQKLFLFDSLDSTNACAKTLAEAGMDEGAVILTDFQTEGRGRLGRVWQSEPGKNLLFSCIFRPAVAKEQAGLLTFAVAISIARALEHTTKLSVECKWPNDLLIGGKKCCGILLENSFNKETLTYSVVGIGVNVNQTGFEESLRASVTSLAQETGNEIDRKKLFLAMMNELDAHYKAAGKGDFRTVLQEWNRRCTMFGKETHVSREGVAISGKAIGLSADGGLILETAQGKETVYAGDVTVIQ
ncbi:MAG TPA: biotin--[acetyl-CoA-carboxylase] ligase [Bacteroidota bacterium]